MAELVNLKLLLFNYDLGVNIKLYGRAVIPLSVILKQHNPNCMH